MPMSDRFHRQCRLLRAGALVVFTGLFLLLAMGMVGLPWRMATDMPEGWNTRALLSVVSFLPGIGYLWALWAVQRALADLSAARLFHPTVARAMRHIGIGVLAGALVNVFAVTNLSRWIAGGTGGYLYFDMSGIVLGVVGAALILLARLVDQARALQAELDEIV